MPSKPQKGSGIEPLPFCILSLWYQPFFFFWILFKNRRSVGRVPFSRSRAPLRAFAMRGVANLRTCARVLSYRE